MVLAFIFHIFREPANTVKNPIWISSVGVYNFADCLIVTEASGSMNEESIKMKAREPTL